MNDATRSLTNKMALPIPYAPEVLGFTYLAGHGQSNT